MLARSTVLFLFCFVFLKKVPSGLTFLKSELYCRLQFMFKHYIFSCFISFHNWKGNIRSTIESLLQLTVQLSLRRPLNKSKFWTYGVFKWKVKGSPKWGSFIEDDWISVPCFTAIHTIVYSAMSQAITKICKVQLVRAMTVPIYMPNEQTFRKFIGWVKTFICLWHWRKGRISRVIREIQLLAIIKTFRAKWDQSGGPTDLHYCPSGQVTSMA